MEVIFIKNPEQTEDTKSPQLINGKLYNWKINYKKLKGTLKEELDFQFTQNIRYFLIYDIRSTDKYFCDQGCKPGEKGCKENYIPNNHALILSYFIIK